MKLKTSFLFFSPACISWIFYFAGCAASPSPLSSAENGALVSSGVFSGVITIIDGEKGIALNAWDSDDVRVVIPARIEKLPVLELREGFFSKKTKLEEIVIPDFLKSISTDVFFNLPALKKITVSKKNKNYEIIEQDLYDRRTGKMICYPEAQNYFQYRVVNISGGSYAVITGAGNKKKKVSIPSHINGIRVSEIARGAFQENSSLAEIIIPQSIFRIGDGAFAFCPRLTAVSLSASLETIPFRAFYECSSLTKIIIPDSVTVIGANAFSDCKSLVNVLFGSRVRELGDSAFSGCAAIISLIITERIEVIGNNAFSGCEKLQSILVSDKNNNYSSVDGVLFNKNKTELVRYPEGKPGKQYIIPSGVEKIGQSAFSFCSQLSAVIMGESLISIGSNAFFYCTSLYSVRFGGNIITIGDDAFSGCASFADINLPKNLTSIGKRAFASCRVLKKVRIPGSVTFIGENAFRSCSQLAEVVFSHSTTIDPGALFAPSVKITYAD